MNLKKIILTVTNDLTYDQRMSRICETLDTAGYAVTLIGRERSYSVALLNKNYTQIRLKCIFNKGKFFYIEYNIRLFFYLLTNRFDAINAVDLDTLLACFMASKIKAKPCIYDAHEYFTEVPEVINRPFIKKIWTGIEAFIIPKLTYCYTVSDSIAHLFNQKYKTPFVTIRNVPVLHLQEPQEDNIKTERYLIYQGALNQGRGLEQLIAAMPLVNCKLYLAGEGDLSDILREKVDLLQLNHKVKFLGFVQPSTLKTITRKAYLGINVSENLGLSYYYSLNNKCFDYIHAGIPSITNNFPEYAEINSKYQVALLVDLSVENLVNSLNSLLLNDVLYQKLKNNCTKASEEFNWQIEESKLLQLYSQVG